MNIQETILDSMEEILGLDKDELKEDPDLNLVENGLVDSLGIVTLINDISKKLGKKIAIKQIQPQDFTTINRLTAAIEKQI